MFVHVAPVIYDVTIATVLQPKHIMGNLHGKFFFLVALVAQNVSLVALITVIITFVTFQCSVYQACFWQFYSFSSSALCERIVRLPFYPALILVPVSLVRPLCLQPQLLMWKYPAV